MHQMVRVSSRGLGAANIDDGPRRILEILADAGVNLRMVGGTRLHEGGEFVFSVHHAEEEDDRDRPDREAALLLARRGYVVRMLHDLEVCELEDEPGALLACVRRTEEARGPIAEMHVGTAGADGRIPVQLVPAGALLEAEDIKPDQ